VHRSIPFRAALAAAALLVSFAPARAQSPIPDTNTSVEGVRVRAEAMQGATETLNAWRTAWERDDVGTLMRLYQKDALLVLPGGAAPLQGAPAIEQALRANLPHVGLIELGTVDAAVDDHLLYLYQRFIVAPGSDATGAATGQGQTGTATLVMQREGSRWKIRAQIFSPEQPSAQASAAPPPSPVQAAAGETGS
jgi:ketosteroid isomerase-like protein